MKAAPDAIYERDDGLVVIDPKKAKGNQAIVDSCLYGVIHWNGELSLAQKCTGCAHLLDRRWQEPRCADACPTGALRFKEESELDPTGLQPLLPDAPGKPRVYYKGIPGNLIAGMLYDSEKKEIVEGATVILTKAGGVRQTSKTNGGDDFCFEGLAKGVCSVEIPAQGYQGMSIGSIDAQESVSLGDSLSVDVEVSTKNYSFETPTAPIHAARVGFWPCPDRGLAKAKVSRGQVSATNCEESRQGQHRLGRSTRSGRQKVDSARHGQAPNRLQIHTGGIDG